MLLTSKKHCTVSDGLLKINGGRGEEIFIKVTLCE